MGLDKDFKKYVASTFPECIVNEASSPDGVVVDCMVILHQFKPRTTESEEGLMETEDEPAKRLVNNIWWTINDASHAALCFDVTETTPVAKEIEWGKRPKAEVAVTPESVAKMLLFHELPHYDSIVSSRAARHILCEYVVQEIFKRLRSSDTTKTVLVLDDGVPRYAERVALEVVVTERPELSRTLHGEADVSGIFAAHVLRGEHGCASVQMRTSDTDWAFISVLNPFPGMSIKLTHFDYHARTPVHLVIDATKLNKAVSTKYGVSAHEWATLVATRGTDYCEKMLKGVPDWTKYMDTCSNELLRVKRKRGVTDVATSSFVDTDAIHETLVAASKMPRANLAYDKRDGALARLAFHVLYSSNAPLNGGAGLDCLSFGGWSRPAQSGVVKRAAHSGGVFSMPKTG